MPDKTNTALEPVLQVMGISAAYGRKRVLHDVDLRVASGEYIGIIGHNGAGKSTLLRVISGMLQPTLGSITLGWGHADQRWSYGRVRPGVAMVPQGRAVFPSLSVLDNLAVPVAAGTGRRAALEISKVFELFPILEERGRQLAGTLSGGEQRMLAVGMALRMSPELLLLDEPSLGLSPVIVHRLMSVVSKARLELGYTMIVVEQNLEALRHGADRLIGMRQGAVVWHGTVEDLANHEQLWSFM
jgi:branched-chain amino acid transport system ATP-binding protein